MEEWYAIIADNDVLYPEDYQPARLAGTVEYPKGTVISYGSVVDDSVLASRGLRKVSIGQFDDSGPDFTTVVWDPTTETLIEKPQGVG